LSKTEEMNEAQSSNSSNPYVGSSMAQTVQLNQLLTQLNNLLQQQTPDFVHSKDIFSSPKINSDFKIANMCQNTNR
jgi:hypothetical protein